MERPEVEYCSPLGGNTSSKIEVTGRWIAWIEMSAFPSTTISRYEKV